MRLSRVACLGLAVTVAGLGITGCKGLRSSGGDGGTTGGGFFSTLASLVGFEGEIDLAIAMPGLSGSAITTTLKLKGKKMRMDYGGTGALAAMTMGIIYDGETKKSYTLMPATHTYTETDLSKTPTTPPTTGPKPIAKKTGTSDKIAGYECENWIVTTPGSPNANELCVAHGLTFYAMGFGPFASFGSNDAWGGALDGGGFPLRMRMLDGTGKETMRMEATRIERKSEPDSDFEIPKGYTLAGGPGGHGSPYGGGGHGGGP